jgi:hypothetical protein
MLQQILPPRYRGQATAPSLIAAITGIALSVLLLASNAQAALEQDLGQGLAYVRVTDLSADLPVLEKVLTHPAVVLDLRNTPSAAGKIAELTADLNKTPSAHAVRLVLLSATTAPDLIEVVSSGRPGIVTLGARSAAITPDIALAVSSEEDRHAYDAFGGGTPLEKLLSSTLEKKRFDEAALVRDRASGATGPGDVGPDDDATTLSPEAKDPATATPAPPPAKKIEPAPLIDVVLQRAVQLHRALLALKKI